MLLRGAEGLSFNNPHPRQLAGPRFLHELIPHQGTSEGTPALDYSDKDGRQRTLSYDELHRLSGRLAARIARESPLEPARSPLVVPVMIPQSPELYLSLLAILKCGGAFCPLNLDTPPERIRFILGDVKASIVLTTRALAPSLPQDGGVAWKVLCVEELDLDASSETNGVATNQRRSNEHHLAYVMYTSGSTGTPKGVGVSHLAATQSLLAHDRHIPGFSRFLQFAAPTFDVSVFEIFFPLFRGATLVCCDRTWLLTDLPGAIRQLDVDACELTPSVAGSLLKSRRQAPNLRLLLTIGEMLTQPVIEEFGGDDQNPSMLWGMYGPTEAAIHCTLQPAFRKNYSTRCIGYPLETVSSFIIRITDETDSSEIFEVLPIGEEGELAVGGHQLASEYINRPEQTAQAFIDTKYGRVYKTGDKALMRPDGSIECLGRVSEGQVKLNGQRMELGEIEHAILRTAGCHSAYVCVMENLLVAFAAVVEEGRGDGSDIEGRIKATCKTWLPAFMVPAEVVTMSSFPRLPSGKIDRKQMQKDYLEGRYTDTPEARQADTQNDLQRRICELVSHVLQSPVALSTNLLAAGLDSLVSIALAANLRDNGHPVNTLDVMRARTTLDLCNLLSDVVPSTTDNFTSPSDTNSFNRPDIDLSILVNGNLKDVEGHYRCTELQKSMVSETLKDPRLYINTMDVAFPPGHGLDDVKSCILHIAACNAILRTGFMHSGDELIQIVWDRLKEDQVQIVEDFSPSPPLDTEQFLERPFRAEITADSSTLAAKARLFVHHALYDGWSFDLLLDDLTALAKGRSPTQRPQFHEIAQRLAPLPNGDHNSIIIVHEFWADHLRGASSHSLPNFRTTACGNPEILSFCGEIPIDPVDVRQVSLETASSSQAIFHTGLVWLWSAITGSDDVTIGSVFSGRTLPVPGIEKVIGPLIQTLPVRTKLGQCRTIRDLVRSLHSTNQQILQLTPISLASIRKTAGLPQSCRLFDVLFVYQDSLSNRARGADSVREVEHKDYSEVKLLVEIEPRKDKFSYRWTWHTDCFSSSHIESLAKNLGHLVNYVVKHIDEPISSISTSFPHDMLSTYTPSNKVPLSTSNIVAVFESTAAGNFDHTALCFAHTIRTSSISTSLMTYKELDETANQVARYIHAQNIKAGGIVAIIMEKSPWLYCSILGILKAGCAYLPILPSTPSRRIQLIFRQAQPQLCILDNLSTLGNENVGDFPSVIFDANILKQYSVSNLDIGIHPSQLAYIIYTSGTTGAPKGVSVTHQNLLSNIEVLSRIYPHDHTSSRMLQICSQAFDVSVFEIFFTWANGMCLCAGTNNTLFEDLELSIRQLEVTHLSMTVTVASLVDPVKVPGVSFLVTSGEPMTDEVAAKWCPKLYQGYGPSETTNICTVRKMSLGDSSQYLGGSFDNTPTFVLTVDSTAPVPIGCIGELCFGGDQVAAGYLNMPDLTASKFIDHPDYGRIYRSGDLGRMLPDGSLIILGRIDTQIKLRGQRIELQDVHANIMSSGLARSCASIVSKSEEDANKTQHLTSFYVPLHSMEDVQHFSILEMDDDALRAMNLSILQTLQAALPPYMLPTFLIPISQTPLTSSGKINTSALHDSVRCLTDGVLQKYTLGGGGEEWDTAGPKWTDLERTIASALAETLEIDPGQVSRWTSFLVIGLDSLTAMAFTRKLNKVLNQSRVTISEVLKHTSVARLSNFVSSRREPTAITETNSGKASLLPDDICADIKARLHDLLVESVLPCTPLQEAMLASSVSSSDRSTAYCNQLLFRLERAPDEIRRYWNEMCSRHGILRTCFVTTNNTDYPFLQVVLTSSSFALPWSYLETSADVMQSAREHIHTAFQRPVDSLKPPLGLAFIHDASSDVRHLSFVCHHALYDGVAMEQLLSEVEALAHGQTLLEPPIPFSYFLQETLTIPPGTESFWKTQFNAFVPQKLPSGLAAGIDLSETSVESRNNATIRLKAIETRAHEYGVPLSSICQAAWAMTLSAVLRTEDVCFGNVVSGRSVALEGVDRLVAPCFNAVPLRIDMSPLSSKTELLKRCRDANVDILPFQFTPLRKVQALLGGSPLFDTMVLLQPPSRALDNTVWSLEEERGDMDVPLICEFITAVDSDTLRVVIHHQENHVSDSMACLLRDIVLQALRSCMESQFSGLDLLVSMSPSVGSIVQGLRAAAQAERRADDNNSAAPHTSSDEEEPMTGVQLTVRNIVARLGKINGVPITATTSLHRLGIDSIGMVQLVYLLRQEGLAISPVEVFENPTCAGIAPRCTKIVDTEEGKGGKPSAQLYDMASFQRRVGEKVLTVQGHSVARILPCTPVQQGMISQSIHSHGGTYINSVSWDLDFSVDMGSLEGAWKRVSERHDILRAGFLPISDPDASFAMVIKSAEENAPTIEVLVHEAATAFDTISWRTRCRDEIMRDLLIPPWRLALVHQEESSNQMHLVMHHALYDASSLRRLLTDLAEVLLSEGSQNQTPMSGLSIESAIGTVFTAIASEKPDAERFWRSQATEAVINPFPTMTPLRVKDRATSSRSRQSSVPLQALRQQAAKAEVTLQAALQSTWARILSAYLGESSVTFGVVLDSRAREEGEGGGGALFPQITTLPVIANAVGESNREILGSMMAFNANLRRYLNTPLSQVQKWLKHAESPLFDTILVYQMEDQRLTSAGGPWQVRNEAATVDYPISFEIEETNAMDGPLHFNIVYRTDILPTPQAELILAQFDAILSDLLEYPEGSASELTSTAPDVFSIFPAHHAELPSPGVFLLHEFVERSAESTPDNIALEYVEELGNKERHQNWTYRELNAAGNQVAHLLMQRGVKPGDIVAVCFDKCPEAYLAILGVLKTGAAFVALDTSAPASRLEFIVRDSGAVALLHRRESESGIVEFLSTVSCIAVALAELSSYPSSAPELGRPITPGDTCYCLYTSGTTGTPKGCLISHDSTVQAMLAFQALFSGHWDQHSRWLQFASLHFDVSILEQYWSWSVGITVVAVPKDVVLSDLTRTISELEITHIDLTPSLARLVHPDEVPSLCTGKNVFITGGEQLRQDILDVWGAKGVIYNAYGPTEATIGVTMYPRVPQNGRSTNIGRQFLNVGSFVFRPGTDIPVLKGAVGELCVSGKLVGKGYLNRPELTEERFPILERHGGERVYRTGDLVRVLHDGCFDFLGRADDQVKLRGQRLEIGEINHTIRAGVANVSDVATLVTRHGQQDRDVLVSFVVRSDNSSEDQGNGSGPPELMVITDTESAKICAEARDTCRAKLPGYMVPTYFLCVPSIPLSANNKAQIGVLKQLFNDISLDQLRQLSSSAAGGEDGASSLVQSTEPQLAQVLARLAGITAGQIRTSNTIYDLGFDSISVIGLARELQADAAYPAATPSIILQNPRLGTLCRQLRTPSPHPPLGSQIVRVKQMISACNHKNFGAVTEALGVSGDDIEYIAPCTPLQEGMLSRSGDGAYFNSFQFTLNAGTAIDRSKGAWASVVFAHSILRTCFLQTPDGYVQIALKNAPLRWTDTNSDNGSRGLQAHIQDRHQQWISGNKAAVRYPLEIDCIQSNGAHTLIVRIFHGVYDARSFDLILERVKAAYRQLEAAQIQGPSFFNVLPHGPLCDYTDTRSFWQRLFEDVEFQPFPRLGQGSKDESDATQTRCLDFGGLEKKRIELGVTQQTIVQAVWLYVLRQQRCPRWPTVGVVLSGRSLMLEGIENTIGPLFNTLPFRVQDASALDWPSLVRETHIFNTSVLPFVHTPLRQIQKWCSRGQPLFDTLFTFDREDASHAASITPDEALWTEVDSSTKADYPLAFEAIVTAGQKLKITLVSQGRTVDSTALRQLLDQFEDAAKALTSQNQFPTRLGTLPAIYDPRRVPPQQSPPSHVVLPNKKPVDFAWTKDACALRDEVAALANLPPEDINEDTNLLQLGLDSIDAIKLVPRLRRVGISLTTNELMRQSSLRDIIERHASTNSTTRESDSEHQGVLNTHIAQLTRYLAENSTLVDLLPGVEVKSVLPTTPLQDSMVAEMIMSDFHRYFNHDVLELLPGTDMQELESALELVISSSPILRTVFIEIPDPAIPMAYCQLVAEQTGPFFRTGVILEDEGQEKFQSVFETARSRASRAKGRSGLLQLTPVRVSPSGRQFVVLSIAHALYDGASLDMFHRDVQAAYRHHGVNNHHEQRPPYVPVLADILNSTTREAEIFWAGFLHGASSTMVPEKEKASSTAEDREAPEVTVHRKQILSTIEASKLKSFCRHNRITTQTLGQACWAVVLSSLTHSLDVTFGVVMSGRDTADAQELMFPTMNTVPVRVVLHGTAMEYLQYTWENLSRINHFQHFPLRSAQRTVGKGPLFNTLFTMQQSRPRDDDESDAIWKSVHSASEVEYPVCIEMQLTDDGLMWRTAYSTDHVAPEDGEQLLRQLDGVLAYFLDDHLDKDVVATDQITQQISLCGLPPFQNAMEDADGAVHHPSTNRIASVAATPSHVLEAQETLIQVLAEASGLEPSTIRPEHSIYHLGLDSISLIKVSSVLRKRGMRANARALLKMTSIAEMAATIVQRDSTSIDGKIRYAALPADQVLNGIDVDAAMTLAGLGKEEVEKILPALPVQVHFLSQWQNTNGALFFWSFDMRLPAIRTTFNIEQAWTKLVKELPILRTRFAATGSSTIPFLQFVTRPAPHPTSASSPGSPTGEEYQSGCPLTYRSSPFVQLSVAKLRGAAGLDLTLKLHHALYDGFSLPIIMRKLKSLCTQDATPTEIDVFKSSWDDFAKSHYVDGIITEQKLFWSGYLEGMAARSHKRSSINGSVFPSSSSSPARTRTSVFRPAALVGAHDLRIAASRGGVSPQALFLAAYAKVLAVQESVVAPTETAAEKSPGKERNDMAVEDVVFGVYLANRASFSNDLETAPCPTLSIVPLRVRFESQDEEIVSVASRIQKDLAEISRFENASVGLWEIEKWTQGGLKIDSFVNFLSLPKAKDKDKAGIGDAVSKDKEETPPEPIVATEEGLATPSAAYMANNAVRKTYMDAIDVEATINGESLDIGVFASRERMSEAGADKLIEHLVATLRGCFIHGG